MTGCSPADPTPLNPAIQVGELQVSLKSLQQRILSDQKRLGLPDNGDTRNAIIRQVVNEQLLLADAARRGLDSDEAARHMLVRIQKQILLDLAYDEFVGKNIQVDEAELRDAFNRINTRIWARHLYAATREQADSLYQMLLAGNSFETLALKTFQDPALMLNGGRLPAFSFDEMEPAFEDVAYALAPGAISTPVKLKHGYSIVQIEKRESLPLLTETQYAEKKGDLAKILRHRKLAPAAQTFVALEAQRLEIKYIPETIQQLWQNFPGTTGPVSAEGYPPFRNLSPQMIVARSVHGSLKLSDLQLLIQDDPEEHLDWVRSSLDLQAFITGLLVRESLLDQARQQQLERKPSYAVRVKTKFEDYLLQRQEDRILAQQVLPDSLIQQQFTSFHARYAEPERVRLAGILIPDQETAEAVAGMLQRGHDFTDLVKHYSLHNASRGKDGDLGVFTIEQLRSEFGWSSELQTGSWVGPLAMDQGFGIFKVLEHLSGAAVDLNDVKPQVMADVLQSHKRILINDFLDEIRGNIPVTLLKGLLL